MANPSTVVRHSVAHPSFVALFQRLPEAAAEAPGRVNLLGDHTDYNGGYVLPMVLPHTTHVEIASRRDRTVHVWSGNVEGPQAHREFSLGQERRGQGWLDYVQAVMSLLRSGGHDIPGMDMRICSEVPLGAGLSSSASLLVAVLRAVRSLLALDLTDVALAKLAHRAETEFVGAPVGIMDQMVCALGRPGFAFFLDAATLQYDHIRLPVQAEWVVIHSGVHHSHATGSYQDRRRECEAASALLGLRWMRDLEGAGRQAVLSRIAELPPPLDARARHVVTENERVLMAMELLEQGNMQGFGALMDASHISLRHDFAVSVPETDLLVDLARAEEGCFGARLTGGGFGGSVVIAVEAGTGAHLAAHVAAEYRAHSGREGSVLLPVPVA
jgi:galactokinase